MACICARCPSLLHYDAMCQVIDGCRQLFGGTHPRTLTALHNYGATLRMAGCYEEAADNVRCCSKGCACYCKDARVRLLLRVQHMPVYATSVTGSGTAASAPHALKLHAKCAGLHHDICLVQHCSDN